VKCEGIDESGKSKPFYFQVTIAELSFDCQSCKVVTLRDISQVYENTQLNAQNKTISIMSGAFSHEMLTPIRCVMQLTGSLVKKLKVDKG
jgi:hypothetical protein